ncbi:MAG: hypothetical protein ABUL64_04295 [Singulisphaera sp.]
MLMVQFFRSRQGDDRRRRVMPEDAAAAPVASSSPRAGTAARSGTRRYPVDAHRDYQPRLIDLIPQSLTRLLLLFFIGALLIGGIEAVYATRALEFSEGHLPAFDLAAERSLNNWFTSLALDLACVVALVIYSLRKHRLDDYHGRYRIWLWAAVSWLWLSIDEAACLHQSIQALLREFLGQSAREAELVSIGGYVLVIGAVALRLTFEMRQCPSSVVALVLAAVTYTGAVVAHFAWLPEQALQYRVLIEEGCEMSASLLLLLSMCLQARFVILDARGLIAAKPAKEAREPAKQRRGLLGRQTKIDAAHDTVRPAGRRSDLDPVEVRDSDEDDDEDNDDDESSESAGGHKLSKAERKALRRQQERQRKQRLG